VVIVVYNDSVGLATSLPIGMCA